MARSRAGVLAPRIVLALVVSALLAGLYSLSGCAGMWRSVKSVAVPAGGAAGGAALGSLAGPAGTIGGAAVGAGLASAIEQNASFRSGEIQGQGSIEKEIERWAAQAPGEVAKSYLEERRARFEAKAGEGWFRKWAWRAVWIAVAYFAFLRRQWIWKTIRALLGNREKAGVVSPGWALVHTLFAGDATRVKAIGDNPIEAPPIPVRIPTPEVSASLRRLAPAPVQLAKATRATTKRIKRSPARRRRKVNA